MGFQIGELNTDDGVLSPAVSFVARAADMVERSVDHGGGVKIDGEKITDMGYTISFEESVVLQAGKRKFAKLVK